MTAPAEIGDVGRVRLFHANLVWPLQLEPLAIAGDPRAALGDLRGRCRETHAWRRIDDEFTDRSGQQFRERHYREFVSFLPYVQRFLYGEGRVAQDRRRRPARQFADPRLPPHATSTGLRLTLQQGRGARRTARRSPRPLFLPGPRPRPAQRRGARPTTCRSPPCATSSSASAAPTRRAGTRTARGCTTPTFRNGWTPTAGSSPARTPAAGTNISASSASTAAPASPSTGPACCARWSSPTPTSRASCATACSNITACRSWPSSPLDRPRRLRREDWVRIGLATTLHPDEPLPVNEPASRRIREALLPRPLTGTTTMAGPNTRFICTGNCADRRRRCRPALVHRFRARRARRSSATSTSWSS